MTVRFILCLVLVTLFTLFALTTACKEGINGVDKCTDVNIHQHTSVQHDAFIKEKRSTPIEKVTLSTHKKNYGKQRLITYVVDWEVPKNIKWNKIDHIAYAFAEPNAKGELKSYTSSNLKSSM